MQVLGDAQLRTIARELLKSVRENVTIDWTLRASVRAGIRLKIRKILKKHKYPPDASESATDQVLEQAELLCQSGLMTPASIEREIHMSTGASEKWDIAYIVNEAIAVIKTEFGLEVDNRAQDILLERASELGDDGIRRHISEHRLTVPDLRNEAVFQLLQAHLGPTIRIFPGMSLSMNCARGFSQTR